MEWTALDFGKYKGKTLPQILFIDPDWFFDACEYKKFQRMQNELRSEANDIYIKARNILPTDSDSMFEYVIYPQNKLWVVGFVSIDKPRPDYEDADGFKSIFHPVLDMNFARQISRMSDVVGSQNILKFIQTKILNIGNKRLTQKIAEDFFNNPDNFDMDRRIKDWESLYTQGCKIEEIDIPF